MYKKDCIVLRRKMNSYYIRSNYSHALIHLTDKTRDEIDRINYASGIFADFQKAFAMVDYINRWKKLKYYRIRENSNKWFASYPNDRKRFNGQSFILYYIILYFILYCTLFKTLYLDFVFTSIWKTNSNNWLPFSC